MSRRINIQETVEARIPTQEFTRIQESAKSSKELPDKITTIVEAIHSGLTRNYTFYPADNLERSVESWTKPYSKPVIKNHDIYEEPVGRVKSAHFKQSNLAPDKHTIELELEITDADTIKKVLDGRYQTLSIGGNTSSAVCSICGKDLVKEGYCGHMKGRTYEGKQAHWIIGEMNFDEISWVNVPADANAQVVHKNTTRQTESTSTQEGGIDMGADQQTTDILEQIDNLVGVTEGAEPATEPEVPVTEGTEPVTEPETTVTEGTEPAAEPTGKSLQEQLDEMKAQLATLLAENTTLSADLEEAQKAQVQAEAANTALTTELTQVKEELTVADEENKALVKQNVTLATYTHKVLAESVATVQVVLGKVEEGALEATVAELTKQTSRSLKEQLSALSAEKPQRQILHVENPAHTGGSEGEVITESTRQEEKPELTLADLAEKINKAMNRQFN